MKFHLQNLKFRYQIILMFLLVFLVMTVGSEIAFYNLSAQNVPDNFQRSAEDAISQIKNTLETRLSIIDERAKSMLINSTFTSTMEQYLVNPTTANSVRAQTVVSDYLRNFERGEALIASSFLYTDRGSFDNYIHYRNQDFSFRDSPFLSVYEEEENMHSVQWLPPMEDIIFQGGTPVIPCVRRFTIPAYQNWMYFIYQLDARHLKTMPNGQTPFFDDIVILDRKGRTILGEMQMPADTVRKLLSTADGDSGEKPGEVVIENTTYPIKGGEISQNGWQIYGLKSKSELLESLRQLRFSILRISCIVLILSMIIILWSSRRLTDALIRLEHQMRNVQNGDFNVRFFYPYRDEIGSLSKSFNYMISTIQRLVKDQEQSIRDLRTERDHVAVIEKQKRKAELRALQAQINPHFLYNTLDIAYWTAKMERASQTSEMIDSLSQFFRHALIMDDDFTTVGNEIEHLRYYIILKRQGKTSFDFELDYEEETLGCRVVKLVLQPLVENAILHGISGIKDGKVEVNIFRDGETLKYEVKDNGAGIDVDDMNQLLEHVETNNRGLGIKNMNDRIKLACGDGYGLSFYNREGKGAVITVTQPFNPAVQTCSDTGRDI